MVGSKEIQLPEDCPHCNLQKDELNKKLREHYGKIPHEEYERMRELQHKYTQDTVTKNVTIKNFEYELHKSGVMEVRLSAVCSKCAAAWDVNHREKARFPGKEVSNDGISTG